jgi:hypothetical protein
LGETERLLFPTRDLLFWRNELVYSSGLTLQRCCCCRKDKSLPTPLLPNSGSTRLDSLGVVYTHTGTHARPSLSLSSRIPNDLSMGFFAKLFRRKGGSSNNDENGDPRSLRRARKSVKPTALPSSPEDDHGAPDPDDALVPSSPRTAAATTPPGRHRPDETHGSQRPSTGNRHDRIVLGPRNAEASPAESNGSSGTGQPIGKYSGPVDLDDTDVETADESNERLSRAHLEQFDLLQELTGETYRSSSNNNRTKLDDNINLAHFPTFNMTEPATTRFSAGSDTLVDGMDDARSDAESSTFNVSTDAEDTEYESLRRSGVLPKHLLVNRKVANLSLDEDTSAVQTDGETSLFPNLLTDDESNLTDSSFSPQRKLVNLKKTPASSSRMQIVPVMSKETSPTSPNSNNDSHTSMSSSWKSPRINGDDGFGSSTVVSFPNTYSGSTQTTASTSPRVLDTAKSADHTSDFAVDPFADFADFSQADFNGQQQEETRQNNQISPGMNKTPRLLEDSTSLTDLLSKAKSKSRSRKSGDSVNSAPAMSSALVRDHYSLSRTKSSSRTTSKYSGTEVRSSHESGASVSDIIKNLEATQPTPNSRRYRGDAMSAHSRDASTSIRSTKERIRARRRGNSRRTSNADSDEDSDGDKDNDRWLFDEVAGALGPRGIAADLESLSGRSNRSRSSGGARSHKSHRSHRSRSSRRLLKGSGESVESHGSRRSRSSRHSRYSTRSYMSQMSEQSRSVANDLLRLEMQLAMVGEGSATEDAATRHSNGSNPRRPAPSASPRRPLANTAAPRRSRVTVTAPAGKLGIILANRSDAKGTIVSGVRTSSVLVEKVSPGDRIVAIDGEDVSLMAVSEITTIMARKSDFERSLTVLTTPRAISAAIDSEAASASFQQRYNRN